MSNFHEALEQARAVDPELNDNMFWHDIFLAAFKSYYGYEIYEENPSKMKDLRTLARTSGSAIQSAIGKYSDIYRPIDRVNLAMGAMEFAFKIAHTLGIKSEFVMKMAEKAEGVVYAD